MYSNRSPTRIPLIRLCDGRRVSHLHMHRRSGRLFLSMSVVVFGFAPHPYVLDTNLDLDLALDHQRGPTQNPLPSKTQSSQPR